MATRGGELSVDDARCVDASKGQCDVVVVHGSVEDWQREFLTALASEPVQRVRAMRGPSAWTSVEPKAASRLQEAVRCLGEWRGV